MWEIGWIIELIRKFNFYVSGPKWRNNFSEKKMLEIEIRFRKFGWRSKSKKKIFRLVLFWRECGQITRENRENEKRFGQNEWKECACENEKPGWGPAGRLRKLIGNDTNF